MIATVDNAIGQGIHVRLGTNDDGWRIGDIAKANGFKFELDWSDIGQSWLVAEKYGKVIGAIQYLYGKPVARIEMLVVDPERSTREIVLTMLALYSACEAVARSHGVKAVGGLVADDAEIAKRLVEERFGAVASSRGTIYYGELL